MELTRIGANRKELRMSAFNSRTPEVSVDAGTGSIKLVVRSADGMGAQGQYDYTATLSPDDFSAILRAVSAHRNAFVAGDLHKALESSAAALVRLLSAASSLPFQLEPTDAQVKLGAFKSKLVAQRSGDAESS